MLTRAYFSGLVIAALLMAIVPPAPSRIGVSTYKNHTPLPTTKNDASTASPLAETTEPPLAAAEACRVGLTRLLATVPIDFRAGDDDLKASAHRLLAGVAEVSMRCPELALLIRYPHARALAEARAKRLALRLRSYGVPTRTESRAGETDFSLTFVAPAQIGTD